MGHVISIGQVVQDQRVLGLSRPIPAVRQRAAISRNQLEEDMGLDPEKLETSSHSCRSIDVIDIRLLRDTVERVAEGPRYKAVRRFGIAALVLWCILSTTYTVMTLQTVQELNRTLTEIQQSVKAAQ